MTNDNKICENASQTVGTSRELRVHPDAVFRLLGDSVVVVHLRTNRFFELNNTAAAIWTLLDAGNTEERIAEEISQTFDCDGSRARKEVGEFCSLLLSEELVIDCRSGG